MSYNITKLPKLYGKITAVDGGYDDRFGHCIAMTIDGSRMAVGAPFHDSHGVYDSGSVYVYYNDPKEGWIQEAKLIANDFLPDDNFGYSVDISGDGARIAIGALKSSPNGIYEAGSVYVFLRHNKTWKHETILTANNIPPFANFGNSVSISKDGDTIAIGSYNQSIEKYNECGCVYIYKYIGIEWIQTDIIEPVHKTNKNNFGYKVLLNKADNCNSLLISEFSLFENTKGKIYLYSYIDEKWKLENIYVNEADSNFGLSISMNSNGDRIAISGSTFLNNDFKNCVFIYDRIGLNCKLIDNILLENIYKDNWFGYSILLNHDGSVIYISDIYSDTFEVLHSGVVYKFIYNEVDKKYRYSELFIPDNCNIEDNYGLSLASSSDGRILSIGSLSPKHNSKEKYYNSGAVYTIIKES